MTRVFSSASKIVFIAMALATIGLTFVRIIDAKDFIILASMAFSFYFSKKPEEPLGDTSKTTVETTTVKPPITTE